MRVLGLVAILVFLVFKRFLKVRAQKMKKSDKKGLDLNF